jgi:hypothetical protein
MVFFKLRMSAAALNVDRVSPGDVLGDGISLSLTALPFDKAQWYSFCDLPNSCQW